MGEGGRCYAALRRHWWKRGSCAMFYAAGVAAVATATTQEVNPTALHRTASPPHALLPLPARPHPVAAWQFWPRWQRECEWKPSEGQLGVLLGILARKKLCWFIFLLLMKFAAAAVVGDGEAAQGRSRGREELGQHDEFVQRQWALKLHAH